MTTLPQKLTSPNAPLTQGMRGSNPLNSPNAKNLFFPANLGSFLHEAGEQEELQFGKVHGGGIASRIEGGKGPPPPSLA